MINNYYMPKKRFHIIFIKGTQMNPVTIDILKTGY